MFQPRYIVAGTYIYDPYWDLLMMFIYMNTLFASKLLEIWSVHNHVVNNELYSSKGWKIVKDVF